MIKGITSNMIINVNELKRTFSSDKGGTAVEALKGVTFSIKKGEIFGLLGPNGAGKSTIIKILSTVLLPTSGSVEIFGLNIYRDEELIREKINFIFGGERSLYFRLSAKDNLYYFADLYKIPHNQQPDIISKLLDIVGLGRVGDRKVETFSKGMKQRLQIARALLNDPEIIFLDEPSIGLDPQGARDLRNIIRELSQRGKTILVTTHYMAEAEELCDRIAIINNGEIITCGTIKEIESILTDEQKSEIVREKSIIRRIGDVTLEDIYLKLLENQ